MRGSTTPTLPGGPSRPPWTPSGQPFAAGSRVGNVIAVASRPEELFALLVDTIEQRALRSPLQPLTRRPSCPWTQTGVSSPATTKAEMSALPLETHRPFGAGDALRFAGHAARGTREEGRRADRLRCWHGSEEARTTNLLSSPRQHAGRVRCARPQFRPFPERLYHTRCLCRRCPSRTASAST